jgi:hypothetical protein
VTSGLPFEVVDGLVIDIISNLPRDTHGNGRGKRVGGREMHIVVIVVSSCRSWFRSRSVSGAGARDGVQSL